MSAKTPTLESLKNVFVVGLTGGIGSGKTAASNYFQAQHIEIVDADIIARDVVAIGTACLHAIHQHFGDDILLEDGSLDRQKLREIVFNNPDEKSWLNALLHPAIREKMLTDLAASQSPYVIFSVPLLFENDLDTFCNCTLLIDVDESTQIARTVKRDSSNEALVKQIMASQMPRQDKRIRANYIVSNEGSLEELHNQLAKLHTEFLLAAKS